MKNKHNGIVSLWKFLFAIVIVFFHGGQFYGWGALPNPFFKGGYIAVEFFFIICGFYLASSVLKEEYHKETIGQETIKFIFKRIKSIIPYILIIFILSLAYDVLYLKSLKPNEIANSIWNLLLLSEFGFRSRNIVPQTWYLTSMYIGMFILYPLLKKYKENFIKITSPIIILFGLGYLSHYWFGLDHSHQIWNLFTKTGIYRGFIEINIGMTIYLIHQKLKNINYTKLARILLTILGELLLIIVLVIINYFSVPKYYDYIMLLFISISILIITSEKTYEYNILSTKSFYYLEKLSLPIYLNHVLIINIVYNTSPLNQMH